MDCKSWPVTPSLRRERNERQMTYWIMGLIITFCLFLLERYLRRKRR